MSETLSLALFSGTADKLHAAATMAAGAAALDRPVNILLQYWALDAFRRDRIEGNLGLSYDSMAPGTSVPVEGAAKIPWLETFRMAKELGDGQRSRPARAPWRRSASTARTLDPLVDGPCGIAAFLMAAEDGQILFI